VVRDTDLIERDIERARAQLAGTLDELTIKANPKRLVENAKKTVLAQPADPKVRAVVIGAGALIAVLMVRKMLR
jgi:hypothetical protein